MRKKTIFLVNGTVSTIFHLRERSFWMFGRMTFQEQPTIRSNFVVLSPNLFLKCMICPGVIVLVQEKPRWVMVVTVGELALGKQKPECFVGRPLMHIFFPQMTIAPKPAKLRVYVFFLHWLAPKTSGQHKKFCCYGQLSNKRDIELRINKLTAKKI